MVWALTSFTQHLKLKIKSQIHSYVRTTKPRNITNVVQNPINHRFSYIPQMVSSSDNNFKKKKRKKENYFLIFNTSSNLCCNPTSEYEVKYNKTVQFPHPF